MSISIDDNPNNNSKRNILSSHRNRIYPLTYSFVNFSSQDPFHPINYLLLKDKNTKGGWLSGRYCIYPQEILIQFPQMVNIRQINILINESKIPKMIEFINCVPVGDKNKFILNNNNNSRIIPSEFDYQNIGFIKLSSNVDSKYKSRELRKIYININSEFLKLKIHKNYENSLNMFCQVGIVSLEFLGTKKEVKKKIIIPDNIIANNNENNNNENNNIVNNNINDTIESLFDVCFNTEGVEDDFIDEKMDKQTNDKVKELLEDMNKKKENEEYDECKLIKDKIDKIRKMTLKIYTLEEQKKEYANKNDFDKAKEIKFNIEKIKKLLDFYLLDNSYNKSKLNNIKENEISKNSNSPHNNKSIINQKINMSINSQRGFASQSNMDLYNNENFIEYDDIILPSVMKRIKKNNISFNKSGNNSGENSYDSIDNMNFDEVKEKEPLEELDNSLRTKYDLLICFIGEDTLRKIFSKYIYYKEEGFDILKIKVKEIISGQKNTSEANKYIVLLMQIVYGFLDDKHPSIVYRCLDIFYSILKAIEQKSKESNVSYDFTITKKILNKIKEKLNDISKKVRTKAAELYCFMLDTDFCEYNTLLIELIENEVVNNYAKHLSNFNNNSKFKYSSYDNYNYSYNNYNNKYENRSSKQLIITKMGIFLKVLTNFNDSVKRNKTDKQKFPQNILGDFIVMNINHPKDDVRDITKDVMIKFIRIFGNQILNKMKMVIDDKELTKILQDKDELKNAYDIFKNEKIIKEDKTNKSNKINKINTSHSTEGLFLTNVNKKFQNITNSKAKLLPITKLPNNGNKLNSNNNKLIRSSSQPKYIINKSKLKPIVTKRNKNKILINSKSQKTIEIKK